MLIKEELTRQLHQTIQELYPEGNYDPNLIDKILFESEPGKLFTFPAKEFAESGNLHADDFINKLYLELGIEFEKNLHDKFLFKMTRDENTIYFTAVKGNSDG